MGKREFYEEGTFRSNCLETILLFKEKGKNLITSDGSLRYITGIHADIAEAKYKYWSMLAPNPIEVVLAAAEKAKEETGNVNYFLNFFNFLVLVVCLLSFFIFSVGVCAGVCFDT